MTKSILAIGMIAFLCSCGNNAEKTNTVPAETPTEVKTNNLLKVEDRSQYDVAFLEGFAAYEEEVILKENYLQTGGEKIEFPVILSENKENIFKGEDKQYTYTLLVTRTNLTTLKYTFTLKDKQGKNVDSRSGKAILPSLFFLGDESFEDQNGVGQMAVNYNDHNADYWLTISIARETDDNLKYMATISYGNESGKTGFELPSSPVLRADL